MKKWTSDLKNLFTHFAKALTHRTPLARIDLCLIVVGDGVQYNKTKEYFQQSAKHGLIFQQAAEAEQRWNLSLPSLTTGV